MKDLAGMRAKRKNPRAVALGKLDVELCLIHGHGRNRGKSPGFVNTNSGFLGLEIRRRLRNDPTLRKWIHHTTVRSDLPGATTVKLKRNPSPRRTELEFLPERDFR
jgi:hypothetical protein